MGLLPESRLEAGLNAALQRIDELERKLDELERRMNLATMRKPTPEECGEAKPKPRGRRKSS